MHADPQFCVPKGIEHISGDNLEKKEARKMGLILTALHVAWEIFIGIIIF